MKYMEEKLSEYIARKRKEQFSQRPRRRTQREFDLDWKRFINTEVLAVMRIRSLPRGSNLLTKLFWLVGNIRIIKHPKILSIYIQNLIFRRSVKKKSKPFP